MRVVTSLALLASLLLPGGAGADLCQFGYADIAIGDGAPILGWVGAQNAGVPQDSGRIIPLDSPVGGAGIEAHTRDIRSYIQAMNASGIRPLVDLSDVLFKRDALVNPNCGAEYERGHLRNTTAWERQAFKPGAESKITSFLALNASELGTDSIRGFIVHVEVNNNCVPAWRVNSAARMLKDRGYGPAQGYVISAGYGLDSTPGAPAISTGMPVGAFPFELSHVTPWAYDIYSLHANSLYNLNSEVSQLGVTGFWNKFVGKLHSSQQVIWGLLALCEPTQQQMFNGPHLPPQNRIPTQCAAPPPPLQGTWPLWLVADQWRQFAEQQPRVEGLIAIQWTGPNGTNALNPAVRDAHITIGNSALTCE